MVGLVFGSQTDLTEGQSGLLDKAKEKFRMGILPPAFFGILMLSQAIPDL
ncbi:MAG: hypothetical protein ACI8TQ_003159 [Planctomycetota bacterium]|jgi:hypothetical protein